VAIDLVLCPILCWVNSTVALGPCIKLNEMGVWKMNERIQELIEQSGAGDVTPVGFHKYLEKFAELIVRECVLQCVHNEDGDLIVKHFAPPLTQEQQDNIKKYGSAPWHDF
jgi:hypothetical protein